MVDAVLSTLRARARAPPSDAEFAELVQLVRGARDEHERFAALRFARVCCDLGAAEVERRLAERDEREAREALAAARASDFTNTSHVCAKCGKRETNEVVRQDRSLDEAPSLYITCRCGHQWRIRQ